MAQYDKLLSAYVQDMAFSFKVGTVDIVANRIYGVSDSDGRLYVANEGDCGALFVPLTAEKAGMPVRAVMLGFGAFTITCSGAVARFDDLALADDGKVRMAVPGDRVVGIAGHSAADDELLTVFPPVSAAVAPGATIVASGTAVLVAGTVTVANTAVLSTDVIHLTRQVTGGVVGHLTVGTIVDETSFVIDCAVNTDTSTVGWTIVR